MKLRIESTRESHLRWMNEGENEVNKNHKLEEQMSESTKFLINE